MRAVAGLLAPALALALAAAPSALAQSEDRGYGGPATVGPNFSTGKQSAPPDYGNGTVKKKPVQQPAATKREAKPAKPAVKPSKPDAAVAKSGPANPLPASQDSPATPASDAPAPAVTAPAAAKTETCRRFDATTSTTIEVPCP
jgi:hypothetical protein